MDPEQRRQQKLRMMGWGQQDLTREALRLLLSHHKSLEPWEVATSWEQQHKMAGEQAVIRDLMKIINEGSL